MFQIKAFLSIIASMVNRLRVVSQVLTDFNVGSNIRVLLEAAAQEIDELYQQMVAALQAAIAQATYISFGFTPLPAVSASTTVQVIISAQSGQVTIGAGTVFTPIVSSTIQSTPVTYTSTAAVTIPAGSTVGNVPVIASVAGTAGNLPANTQFSVGPTPAGFTSASNLVAISNGQNVETPAAQQTRFNAFIASLVKSTLAGIYYGASSVFLTDQYGNVTERVAAVQVFEPYSVDTTQPPWIFKVYVYNGVTSGAGASAALLAAVTTTLQGSYNAHGLPVDGYKAAGTVVNVLAVTLSPANITGVLYLTANTSQGATITSVESAWSTYITGLAVAAEMVLAELVALALAVPGVTDCQISAPTANIAGATGVQITPGVFNLTCNGGSTP